MLKVIQDAYLNVACVSLGILIGVLIFDRWDKPIGFEITGISVVSLLTLVFIAVIRLAVSNNKRGM